MSMRRALWPPLLLTVIGTGCGSVQLPPEQLGPELDRADAMLATDPAAVAARLGAIDPDALIDEDLEKYKVVYADALFRTGEAWDAFEQIRDFVEDHRFSDWSPRVEELQFQIGAQLIQSSASYFIFGSDADDGEIVLQEFIERYSTNPHAADALRLLGGYAYSQGRWLDARRRYEMLLREQPNSEWVALAAFRRVMSIHADLLGPEYDLAAMQRARAEFRDYLATEPERPEFRRDAGEALAEIDDWIAQRHRIDADFYRTVGNRFGEKFHLQVLIEDSAGHPLVAEAEQRLRALEEGR